MYILSFFSEKVWLSYAHEPNVATRLFLYGLQAKKKKKFTHWLNLMKIHAEKYVRPYIIWPTNPKVFTILNNKV